MTVEEKIYALWSADATATAIIPAARVKPWSANLQNLTIPYILHGLISEPARRRTYGEGVSGSMRIQRWQFTVCALSTSSAQTILSKLISVLDGNHGGFNFHHTGDYFLDADHDQAGEHLLCLRPSGT
mgnify:CR=1 FL=1